MLNVWSEVCLALGLAALSLATALLGFVMFGLLAFPLVAIALTLLAIGVIQTRKQGVSLRRQAVGLLLLIIGIAVLLAVAYKTISLATQETLHLRLPSQAAPTREDWLLLTTAWLLPAGFIASGLRCWAGWSLRRCLFSAIAVFFVCPAALLLYAVLDLPTSA